MAELSEVGDTTAFLKRKILREIKTNIARATGNTIHGFLIVFWNSTMETPGSKDSVKQLCTYIEL